MFFTDFVVKLSTLDAILIHVNTQIRTPQFLYDSFIYDTVLFLNIYYLPFSTLILSGYQEHLDSFVGSNQNYEEMSDQDSGLVYSRNRDKVKKCTNYVGLRDHSVFDFQIVRTYKTIKV